MMSFLGLETAAIEIEKQTIITHQGHTLYSAKEHHWSCSLQPGRG